MFVRSFTEDCACVEGNRQAKRRVEGLARQQVSALLKHADVELNSDRFGTYSCGRIHNYRDEHDDSRRLHVGLSTRSVLHPVFPSARPSGKLPGDSDADVVLTVRRVMPFCGTSGLMIPRRPEETAKSCVR
jgi:hypothetical protein